MARYARVRDSRRVEDQSPGPRPLIRWQKLAATAGDARSTLDIGMWSLNYFGMDDRGVQVMVSLVGPVRVEQ